MTSRPSLCMRNLDSGGQTPFGAVPFVEGSGMSIESARRVWVHDGEVSHDAHRGRCRIPTNRAFSHLDR